MMFHTLHKFMHNIKIQCRFTFPGNTRGTNIYTHININMNNNNITGLQINKTFILLILCI